MAKVDLSIIIVSYNTKNITSDCLNSIQNSLKNSHLSYEIIVVDNNSTDGTMEMLNQVQSSPFVPIESGLRRDKQKSKVESKNHTIKVVFNKENLGFAKANNQAIRHANSDYILFLNSDIIVLDNAIEKLFNFYQKNEGKINFLGGKLLNKDLTPQPSCGPFYSLPVVFGALFLKGDYWGLTRYSPSKLKHVDWISGACILTKKLYLNKINGFDEKIFMYMDEIDLLFRAEKNNYRVFFYPESQFIHLASASSNGRTYPILQVYKGFLYFYKKHHSHLALILLKFLLKLKAVIAIFVGKITKNKYLIKTYEKAYNMA